MKNNEPDVTRDNNVGEGWPRLTGKVDGVLNERR